MRLFWRLITGPRGTSRWRIFISARARESPLSIVLGSLLRIVQNLIGLIDLFHAGCRIRRKVDVGMIFPSQAPVGTLDHLWLSIGRNLQYFIEICFHEPLRLLGTSLSPLTIDAFARLGAVTSLTAKSPTSLTQTLTGDAIMIPIKPRGVAWTGKEVRHHLLARGEVTTII